MATSRPGSSRGVLRKRSLSYCRGPARHESDSFLTVKSLTAARDAQQLELLIKDLFDVYDFLNKGSLTRNELDHVENLVDGLVSANTEKTIVPTLPSIVGRRQTMTANRDAVKSSMPLLSIHASPGWQRTASEDVISFETFRNLQLQLQSCNAFTYNPKRHKERLTKLIQDLKRCLQSDPRTLAWQHLEKTSSEAEKVYSRKPYDAIILLKDALIGTQDLDLPTAPQRRMQLLSWKEEHCQKLAEHLLQAHKLKELELVLQKIETANVLDFDEHLKQSYEDKLSLWQEPFTLHASTLAGAEATVQVRRTDTVATLRECVAKKLGVGAYRLHLSSVSTERKLEPCSATLEELGVCHSGELIALYGQVDRWQEMAICDFLELAMSVSVVSQAVAVEQQEAYDKGKMTREQIQTKERTDRIEQREQILQKEAEAKRRREEEEHKQRHLIKVKLQKAIDQAQNTCMLQCRDASTEELQHKASLQVERSMLLEVLGLRAAIEYLRDEASQSYESQNQIEEEVLMIKHDIDSELAPLLPMLEYAEACWRSVDRKDVGEMKCLRAPPERAKLAMQALCIMLQERPARVRNYDGRMVADFWSTSIKVISDHQLLRRIQHYDMDDIPEAVVARVRRVVELEDFCENRMRTTSKFCAAVCVWVQSMLRYHDELAKPMALKKEVLRRKEALLPGCVREREVITEMLKDMEVDLNSRLQHEVVRVV
eukprot:TRINITY_DN65121_c0_g1_i1.p1 TRINITY_DN65121_c0_g1~~TRINITY_DN65121_c0_g1_i1.p1  ORF type:complete len:714 (-),score=133.85 TRINITY_DN65121_c0_g1_i1:10-2151(-)